MSYTISYDEENYDGDYATVEDAIAEAVASEHEHFWIGKSRPPKQPEQYIDADQIIQVLEDQTIGEEDWFFDWVPDWKGWKPTDPQKKELTIRLQRTIGAWLDKHGLRPSWFVVDDVREYQVFDGKAELVDE